jgi:hypothetical protein
MVTNAAARNFPRDSSLSVYVAASFRHKHGVRLLGRELSTLGCKILDWTEMAIPPPGLTPLERRVWMDTDRDGGQVYAFCRDACLTADMVMYYGTSGQDAGVEIGLAAGVGTPVLGIRGPLEAPGLMLHGAVNHWADTVEEALHITALLVAHARTFWKNLDTESHIGVKRLAERLILTRQTKLQGHPASKTSMCPDQV